MIVTRTTKHDHSQPASQSVISNILYIVGYNIQSVYLLIYNYYKNIIIIISISINTMKLV